MRYLFCALLLCGCAKDPPVQKIEIEIKSDDPALKAMGEAGLAKAREDAGWIKQAGDELERLSKEQDDADAKGEFGPWAGAYTDIKVEYDRRRATDGWGPAARWYVEQVQDKKLTDFKPAK